MVTTRSGLNKAASPSPSSPPTTTTKSGLGPGGSGGGGGWTHAPSTLTLLWLAVSLPLVAWDCVYILLRPWTMAGGALHWPLYVPYALYGSVDYVYGWPALTARAGFPSAQGALNVAESVMYFAYLWAWARYGVQTAGGGSGSGLWSSIWTGREGRRVMAGRPAAAAVLVGFSAAVMTVSKTALYWLIEWFGDFSNIGHNSLWDLIILWIIPNGAWLVFPSFMIYELGSEIIDGLAAASSSSVASTPAAIKAE
ncbi:hypothetical protein GGR56DRAFT_252199 [Xylariaceae sp. FL0804]|nr:hypothetical protein GGR56DRAFT_252199 [Xylariaceae sp. FL0804]